MASIIIAIISAVISLVAIIVSIRSFLQGKKEAFQNEAQKLISQKNEFLNSYMQICTGDFDDETREYLMSEITGNYCNAFESACSLYLKNAIDKQLFKATFIDEVKTICSGEGIAAGLELPVSRNSEEVYKALRTVGTEWGVLKQHE